MSDFDPCECVWNHESAMQRLINMLRSSQDVCTDTECFTALGPQNAQGGDGNPMLFVMFIGWLIIAGMLFMSRPNSVRRRTDRKNVPDRPHRDDDQNPPPTAT